MKRQRWWRWSIDVGETQLFELLANKAQCFFYMMLGTWKTKIQEKICYTNMLGTHIPYVELENTTRNLGYTNNLKSFNRLTM